MRHFLKITWLLIIKSFRNQYKITFPLMKKISEVTLQANLHATFSWLESIIIRMSWEWNDMLKVLILCKIIHSMYKYLGIRHNLLFSTSRPQSSHYTYSEFWILKSKTETNMFNRTTVVIQLKIIEVPGATETAHGN